MEGRLGHDSDVRVHDDSAAQRSAQSVNAHAYTVGSNIVLQRDQYDPDSDSGRTMLAHDAGRAMAAPAPAQPAPPAPGPAGAVQRDAEEEAPPVQRAEAPKEEEEETAQGSFVQRVVAEGEEQEEEGAG